MILRKVTDPDGEVNWYGTDRDAVNRAATMGGTIICRDVRGAVNIAALLMREREEAARGERTK